MRSEVSVGVVPIMPCGWNPCEDPSLWYRLESFNGLILFGHPLLLHCATRCPLHPCSCAVTDRLLHREQAGIHCPLRNCGVLSRQVITV